MFTITEINVEKAEAILYGFIERLADEPDIFEDHRPRHLAYDSTATLTYEGTIVRGGGAEASVFHIEKPGSFLLIIYAPEEHLPLITVAGDFDQAERFLLAFQIAGGAWD